MRGGGKDEERKKVGRDRREEPEAQCGSAQYKKWAGRIEAAEAAAGRGTKGRGQIPLHPFEAFPELPVQSACAQPHIHTHTHTHTRTHMHVCKGRKQSQYLTTPFKTLT